MNKISKGRKVKLVIFFITCDIGLKYISLAIQSKKFWLNKEICHCNWQWKQCKMLLILSARWHLNCKELKLSISYCKHLNAPSTVSFWRSAFLLQFHYIMGWVELFYYSFCSAFSLRAISYKLCWRWTSSSYN